MNKIDSAENRSRIANKESFKIIGGRRMGKTYFVCEMVTHLTNSGFQVCLLTPGKISDLPKFTKVTKIFHNAKALLNIPYRFDYIFLEALLFYMNHIDTIRKKFTNLDGI